jgi:hypothetical protein
MAQREHFQLQTEMRFEPDNPAVEAICLVIEDNFGKGSIQSAVDDEGNIRAQVRIDTDRVDARWTNWLHAQLASLAKYLLAPAHVDCTDGTGRESGYRVDPAPIDAAPASAGSTADDTAHDNV